LSLIAPTNDRETATVEQPNIYWPLLDALTQHSLKKHATQKEYYEAALQLLKSEFLVDLVALSSFELGLSLHTAAPKVEAYYQFYRTSVVHSISSYEDCGSWVLWRGEQICSPDDLEMTLRKAGEKRYCVLGRELILGK